MTLSTSAVAVCCCSDSRSSFEQPRVLDGDDGLGGECSDKFDLLVGKGRDLGAVKRSAPTGFPSRKSGTPRWPELTASF